MSPLIWIGTAVAGLALLANKKGGPAIIAPGGTSFATGASGTQYALQLGAKSEAGQTVTVANVKGRPLFTFIQFSNGTKSFFGSSPGVEPGELAKALADFGMPG
jgi:hypothetical protein